MSTIASIRMGELKHRYVHVGAPVVELWTSEYGPSSLIATKQ
jgi:hypothetical protein